MSDDALRLQGLTKHFGSVRAVDGLDLVVPAGSLYGLVGPNGAGKTTSILMSVGLLRPDGGVAEVFGADVWSSPVEAKTQLGVLPDSLPLPAHLSGWELLTYQGLLRGMDEGVVASRVDELLDVLELTEARHTLVRSYSTGMTKKVCLATALLHAPRLLVLDEPFESVDPLSAATIKRLLQRFVASGRSVLFSSHVMPVVEQLCDHVAVMAAGRVAASGTVAEIRGHRSLEDAFVSLVGGLRSGEEELPWLAS